VISDQVTAILKNVHNNNILIPAF